MSYALYNSKPLMRSRWDLRRYISEGARNMVIYVTQDVLNELTSDDETMLLDANSILYRIWL
jgi:hypothetical protein